MSRCLAVLGLLAVFVVSPVSAADDWPQWRGPKRDAISTETGLLKEWPKEGPTVVWKVTDVGAGFSTVSIVGGKLFTMGDRSDSSYLICLDVTNGKELWASKIGQTGGDYKGTRSTPTVDGDLVFAIGQFGDLVCFETAGGKEVWRKNFKKDWGGKEGGNWGCSESPLVDGEKLICTPGGRQATMVALNKKTGAEIWKGVAAGTPSAGHSSVVIAEVGGVRQYVNLTAGGVVSFNAKDGSFFWKYGDGGKLAPNTANIPTCIVKGDHVFCSAGYGKGGALLKMTPDDKGGIKAEEVWFERSLSNKHGGFVLLGDHLYGDHDESGKPRCVEFKTGKMVWEKDKRTTGSGSAAVTYADGHLYVRYQNGVMTLVKATTEGFTEVSAFKIPNVKNPSWSHPVIWNGKLFLKEQDTLYCYDVKQRS